MNKFSKNLKFLRKQRALSQDALARELDLKRNNIAAYESKNVEPRLDTLVKFADYFDIPLDELVTGDLSNEKDKYLSTLHSFKDWNTTFREMVQDLPGLLNDLSIVSEYVLKDRCYKGSEFNRALVNINAILKDNS